MGDHFTLDNTWGYSHDELRALNDELSLRLKDIEPHTDTWYDTIKRFEQEVADR